MCAAELAVISVLFLSGHPSLTAGQESVCGSVHDQTGAVLADARVELRGGGSRWNASSDSAGEFCFEQVASASYELVIKREGFKKEQREVVLLPVNRYPLP